MKEKTINLSKMVQSKFYKMSFSIKFKMIYKTLDFN